MRLLPFLVGFFFLVVLQKIVIVLVFIEIFRRLQFQRIGAYDSQVRATLIATNGVAFVDVFFVHIDQALAFRTSDHQYPPEILLIYD